MNEKLKGFGLSDGRPTYAGKRDDIEQISIFGLNVGDKVSAIGKEPKTGKGAGMAYLNRYDKFKTFVIYSGVIRNVTEYTNETPSDYMLFEVPPDEFDANKYELPVYLLYGFGMIEGEIFCPDLRLQNLRIYKPIFSQANNLKQNKQMEKQPLTPKQQLYIDEILKYDNAATTGDLSKNADLGNSNTISKFLGYAREKGILKRETRAAKDNPKKMEVVYSVTPEYMPEGSVPAKASKPAKAKAEKPVKAKAEPKAPKAKAEKAKPAKKEKAEKPVKEKAKKAKPAKAKKESDEPVSIDGATEIYIPLRDKTQLKAHYKDGAVILNGIAMTPTKAYEQAYGEHFEQTMLKPFDKKSNRRNGWTAWKYTNKEGKKRPIAELVK